MNTEDQEMYNAAIAMPLDVKVSKAIATFQHYAKSAETWDMFEPWLHLSSSGGKDSELITWLAQKAGVPFKIYNNLTTLDPPELIHFFRKQHPEAYIYKPDKPLLRRLWEDDGQGPPTRMSRWCCEIYKEQGCFGQIKVFGIRASESNRRKQNWRIWTPMKNDGSWVLNPILYFTDKDVWTVTREEKIPYCSLYDEGFRRLGCIGCPMAGTCGRKREFERWPKYHLAWQRAFQKFWSLWHGRPLIRERWVSMEGKYPFEPLSTERKERRYVKEREREENGFWTYRRWYDLKGYQTWQELWAWWMQDEEEPEGCTMGMF